MQDAVADLQAYVDASPTPYHAVAESVRRLEAAGYRALAEEDGWLLSSGDRRYVVRSEGSVIAFEVGTREPAEGGLRIVGAHSDSPNLRVKAQPRRVGHGLEQLVVEPYGGLLLHTWFDRDCSLAGRLALRDGTGARRVALVDLRRPLLRVPMLAIHLQREIHEQGFKPNANLHAHPLWGLEGAPQLTDLLRAALAGTPHADHEILAWDLMLYDVQRASRSGADGAFVHAARLDNLASCHAGLCALLAPSPAPLPEFTRVIAFWDHEEVGSRSAQGAAGPFLRDVLSRVCGGMEPLARAVARSALVSADMAHAVHPNFADRHDAQHAPRLGGGPVVKWNANQSYATDGVTGGLFVDLCRRVGARVQHYSHRNDLPCGSTIGPISAALLGIRAVDVGNPMLSMHSCREMCAAADVPVMIDVLRAFFGTWEGGAA